MARGETPGKTSLEGKRVLVTGPTGQVATPVTLALAQRNEVFGIARFADGAARERLEAAGVRCIRVDLGAPDLGPGSFADVPTDVDVVLNLAVAKTSDPDHDLRANVESLGLLMDHCHGASALFHCSSTAVYRPAGHHRHRETDPLGDNNHQLLFPNYTMTKIAAEAMARTVARLHGVPTVIARLNVPYGNGGGWPWIHMEQVLAGQPVAVHSDAPSLYNPIHEDDIISTLPALLGAASVPALTVNWAGTEEVSIEEWAAYIGELVDRPVTLQPTDHTIEPVPVDTTLMRSITGETRVGWREGIRRMVTHFHPELVA